MAVGQQRPNSAAVHARSWIKASAVNAGHFFRGHAMIFGGASRAGAASAGRKYRGAGHVVAKSWQCPRQACDRPRDIAGCRRH